MLDSFAILAYFQAENGGERVLELLNNAREDKVELVMSLINVGEVVYLTGRNRGRKIAEALLKDLRDLPITFFEASEERILASHGSKQAMLFRMQMLLPLRFLRNLKVHWSQVILNLKPSKICKFYGLLNDNEAPLLL